MIHSAQRTKPPNKRSGVAPSLPPGDLRLQTRVAVLDAAERLFAERGVDGVSVRDIITAAGANLGAVNYHFGSKNQLVMEVFARRLAPLNQARVARLDALEKAAGKHPVALSQIIEAFADPNLASAGAWQGHGETVMLLLGRCFAEPNPELKAWVEQQFAEVARRYDDAILRTLPALTRRDIFWGMNFFVGALHHGENVWMRFDQFPHPGENAAAGAHSSREEFIHRLTAFVTAGMQASLVRQPKRPAKGTSTR